MMDAALKAGDLLDLFIRVLAEVRRQLHEGEVIYVCNILDDESESGEQCSLAYGLWAAAGEKFGGNDAQLGWWPQSPAGHAQRMLALESIIADLGGEPQ